MNLFGLSNRSLRILENNLPCRNPRAWYFIMQCWWTWTIPCKCNRFVAPVLCRLLFSAVPFDLIAARLSNFDAICQLRASLARIEFWEAKRSNRTCGLKINRNLSASERREEVEDCAVLQWLQESLHEWIVASVSSLWDLYLNFCF